MSSRLLWLAGAPRRAAALFASGTDRLQQLITLTSQSLKLGQDAARRSSTIEKKVSELDKDMRAIHAELRSLRAELHERLLQYHLLLGRLSRVGRRASSSPKLSGRTVPTAVAGRSTYQWRHVGDQPAPDPEGREWLLLDACAACGSRERTLVNEFNKLIVLDKAPDETSARYDYAICHACGILYAARRPFGSRYRFLLENFGEVTAKVGGDREIKNALLNPYPLSEDDREKLKRLASRGVFVSDHHGLASGQYLDGLLKDRFENSVHLDLIGSFLMPRRPRVLELRPRTGAISESLRRLFGAEVYVIPIWESQRFLLQEVYGIDSAGLVDYDRFDIPYEGTFDLIIGNHMFTHVIRPMDFFATLRQRLSPGGHIYFYNEPDDAEFLKGRQSMLATLNPLHMQAFDHKSLRRGLAANGFDVVFQKSRNLNHLVLARKADTTWTPMTDTERDRRIRAYRLARDRAILGLREELRARFADEWATVVERGVAEGIAEFDGSGRLRLVAE